MNQDKKKEKNRNEKKKGEEAVEEKLCHLISSSTILFIYHYTSTFISTFISISISIIAAQSRPDLIVPRSSPFSPLSLCLPFLLPLSFSPSLSPFPLLSLSPFLLLSLYVLFCCVLFSWRMLYLSRSTKPDGHADSEHDAKADTKTKTEAHRLTDGYIDRQAGRQTETLI